MPKPHPLLDDGRLVYDTGSVERALFSRELTLKERRRLQRRQEYPVTAMTAGTEVVFAHRFREFVESAEARAAAEIARRTERTRHAARVRWAKATEADRRRQIALMISGRNSSPRGC
ncbi:MAG TPA: hypothetical protein VGU20_07690 [Stellaceae bacterium]|nr:hypothetical protein [Stellaceae bacterium]